MKAVKLPVEVDVIQWTGDNFFEVAEFCIQKHGSQQVEKLYDYKGDVVGLAVRTLEGTMEAKVGDYIIKGVKGEFYPCREDIFHLTYRIQQDISQY